MSGHSQGGGEAVYIGMIKRLKGVVALSSPLDGNSSDQPASWVGGVPEGRTSVKRIVAFIHSGDPFENKIAADWTAMGLWGTVTSVDGSAPPYGDSHRLYSSAPVAHPHGAARAAHDSTAVDTVTPMCPNGSAEYAPVWGYALVTAGALRAKPPAPAC